MIKKRWGKSTAAAVVDKVSWDWEEVVRQWRGGRRHGLVDD
jgi:hypothetical protein